MRTWIVFIGNAVIGVSLLAFVLHGYGGEALHVLAASPSPAYMLAFVLSVAATVLVLSWRWGYLLRTLATPLPLWQLALHRSAAHTLSVLVPSAKMGGDPLRAWLSVRARVPAGNAIASVTLDRTQEIATSAPFSIIFATLLLQAGIPQLERALVTVLVGTAGLGIGIVIAVRRLRRGAGLVTALARSTRLDRFGFVDSQMDVIHEAEQATLTLIDRSAQMFWAFVVGLVANVLVIVEFALLLNAFGLPADTTAVVAAIFATGAAHMLPIPAGVGVLEGAQMWLFQALGYPPDVGLAVGLAVRLREIVWMLPGLVYAAGRWTRATASRMDAARAPAPGGADSTHDVEP